MLTATFVRQVKPLGKSKKYTDGRGLYLLVTAAGGRYWRYDYRHQGKRKTLALGTYPDLTLADARQALLVARSKLAKGIDPSAAKREQEAATAATRANTVEAVARRWLRLKQPGWSQSHYVRERRNVEKDLIPWLGGEVIGTVEPPALLAVLRIVEGRGSLDVAKRVLITARGIWQLAIAEGHAQRDITQDIKKALRPHLKRNFPAITDPQELGGLLRACDAYRGTAQVLTALRLSALLFQRPGNIRKMRWADVDLDAALWTIPSADMKRSKANKLNGQPHIVPLPAQAIDALHAIQPVTGHLEFVMNGMRDKHKPMSEAAVTAALASMGYKDRHSWHGYRATARTLLRQELKYPADVIEAQLAHVGQISHGGAYDRATFLGERRAMLQAWADYLDKLKADVMMA